VTNAEAERLTLAFVKRHCYKRTAPLCGNSVGQDKRFLVRYMPQLNDFLHYRVIDVSTIKVLVKEWYGGSVEPPEKGEQHRALADIEDSIAELEFYRRTAFVRP
jgi:oligoribonuclease